MRVIVRTDMETEDRKDDLRNSRFPLSPCLSSIVFSPVTISPCFACSLSFALICHIPLVLLVEMPAEETAFGVN